MLADKKTSGKKRMVPTRDIINEVKYTPAVVLVFFKVSVRIVPEPVASSRADGKHCEGARKASNPAAS